MPASCDRDVQTLEHQGHSQHSGKLEHSLEQCALFWPQERR